MSQRQATKHAANAQQPNQRSRAPEQADVSVQVLLRAEQVRKIVPVSRTTLWRWTRDCGFPRPIRVGNCRFWRADAVYAWIDHQVPPDNDASTE